MTRRWISVAIAGALGLSGCAQHRSISASGTTVIGSSPTSGSSGAHGLKSIASVSTPGDCDAVLAKIKEVASSQVGPYGFGSGWVYAEDRSGDPVVSEASAASRSAEPAGETAAAGTDHSTTNNQVAGVDEADIVKSDGSTLAVLSTHSVTLYDISHGSSGPVQLASVPLDPAVISAAQLLMVGTTLLVLGGPSYMPRPMPAESERAGNASAPTTAWMEHTTVMSISIADKTHPVVTDTFEMDGSIVAARSVEHQVRLLTSLRSPRLQFTYPQSTEAKVPGRSGLSESAEQRATERNQEIIARSQLSDWIPQLRHSGSEQALVPCDRIHIPETFSGIGMTTVVTFNAGDTLSPTGTSLMVPAQVTYMSANSMVVTSIPWFQPATPGRYGSVPRTWEDESALHRFGFDAQGVAQYLASGPISGTVLNQFSIGEVGDVLVVATDKNPSGSTPKSESQVQTFRTEGRDLLVASTVDGLGVGERIQSVRIVGTRAYVVTYRNTDPLYVIDISDPANLRELGELKMPGYSTYLHPISDTKLLGIGRGATETGADTGFKATLMDVADPTNPVELSSWTSPGSYSEVGVEHHAFLWWEPSQTAFIPIMTNTSTATPITSGGLLALGVDATISERAVIAQVSGVVRSMVVGDTLWTVSAESLQANDLATLRPGSSLALPQPIAGRYTSLQE